MSRAPTTTPPSDGKPAPPNPILEVIRNPLARTYALVSAGGLLAACGVVYLFLYSVFGAVALLIIGLAGLVLRWSSAPVLFVFAVTYLLFFPAGLPVPGMHSNVNQIPDAHFRFADLLFVTAALVHLIGLYRYFTAVHIGMPFEAPKAFVKPGVKATVRPAEPVSDPELWRLFARAGAFVLAGQLVWLAVNRLRLDFLRGFPLTVYESGFEVARLSALSGPAAGTPVWLSRFLISVGLFGGLTAVLAFVFWYWRLAQLNRDEGRMTVLDTRWAAHRRDLNRPEAWRGWTKKKLADTLPKKGCGTYFLVIGLPVLLVLLYVMIVGCAGGFR